MQTYGAVGVEGHRRSLVLATAAYPEAVKRPDRDVAAGPFSLRNARWRTWLRVHTPDVVYYRLGWVVPKARDCGAHDWHNNGDGTVSCYHCLASRQSI
jgi:hypothetical protein